MKLSLLTFAIAREWEMDKLIEISKKLGFAGIEFRTDQKHKHGVELDTGKETRKMIKDKLHDAYLEAVGIATPCRFEYSDAGRRRENIERTKSFIELASDIEAPYVRVFGNEFEEGADRDETIKWVGESLGELINFGRPYGVEVLLEMHGDLNFWKYTKNVLKHTGISDAGAVYNSDLRDKVGDSIKGTYSQVKHLIKHVHMHDFILDYPYKELFQLLKDDKYNGYLSAEIRESADAEKVLAYYAKLYYEMMSNLK
jgi:sugar phosphate isomerase/epimerase